MPGQSFELNLLHGFNDYFDRSGTRALAYRFPQMRYHKQGFDLYVDSLDPAFYLAIECKSVDATVTPKLYFKKHFGWPRGVCQIDSETTILNLSGRNGVLAVECRRGKGLRRSCFLVPWRIVWTAFSQGEAGIETELITSCHELTLSGGKYVVDAEDVKQMYAAQDRQYGRKKFKEYKGRK